MQIQWLKLNEVSILRNVRTYIHTNFFKLYGVCKKCNVESGFYHIQTFDCFQNIISFLGPSSLWQEGTFKEPRTGTNQEKEYWGKEVFKPSKEDDTTFGGLFGDLPQTDEEDLGGLFD